MIETSFLSVGRSHSIGAVRGPTKRWPKVCVHECLEDIAAQQPDFPAVVTDEGTVTYAELERRANALAHRLIALGLDHEEAVGVLTERAADLPLAFLAILKAGGVYVPMGADLPPPRLASMAEQSAMRMLIALDGLEPPPEVLAALSVAGGGFVLRPEALGADDLANGAERPDRATTPGDLAAILFTSGSTGRPKGVQLQHDACINMGFGHIDAHGITPEDRILMSSAPGFILGFRTLCLPLMCGAALVPARRALLDEPAALIAAMERLGVTIALVTPSYLHLFGGTVPRGLRCILTAGERPVAADARHYAGKLEYWNMHGATEVCGTICMHRVQPEGDGAIPSGRPFANTTVFLLDEHGREVAPGEVGEIHVAGVGVSRGYLGQPELTADDFIETPFGRAYRTHDLGRWRADGNLETLGRANDVVKVSGQSVSLGELERALARHPDVRNAAAVLHGDSLVAFFEPARPDATGEEDWRAFLAATLPSYMLPSRVVAIPRIPISTAGKVDRQALLELAESAVVRRGTIEAPQGEVETAIAEVWREILPQRADVGRDDNFFGLGGTSLLAIAASQKLQQRGYPVTARTILTAPTLAALAERIADPAPIAADGPDDGRPLATLGQEEFWIAAQLGHAPAGAHISRVLAVRGAAPSPERWQAAWDGLIARHAALRTGFAAESDGALMHRRFAIHELPSDTRLSLDRCTSPAQAWELVAAHASRRFDMEAPPLARAGLILLPGDRGDETLFWFVLHHAVVDGLSARILQDDLSALLSGGDVPARPDGIALATAHERYYLDSPAAAGDEAYWRQRLDGLVALGGGEAFHALPADRARPPVPGDRAAPPLIRRLEPSTVAALGRIARGLQVGLHAVLLALLAAEARRRSRRGTVLIGTGISTRPAGADDAVGLFVNVLPLALVGEPDDTLARQIAGAQAELSAAMDHAGYPASLAYRTFRQRHPHARPAGRTALCDISLTENTARFSAEPGAPFALVPRRLPGETASPAAGLDLAFSYEPLEDGGLDLTLCWNPDVYRHDTAEGWLAGFANWARWLAENEARAQDAPPPLLPAETALLEQWERGPVLPRPALRFHELFEARVDAEPDHPAIICEDSVLSYRELDDRANGVAASLAARNVGCGDTVAVLTEVCPDLPAAVLGIWKIGAIYMPLSPEHPAERLAFMVRDADASTLIVLDGHTVPPAVTAVCPEVLSPADWQPATTIRPGCAGADDPAYLIYTSGTTGKPKGVVIAHAGAVNTILGSVETIGVTPSDRIALVATPTFDASIWELGLGLLTGAALVPVSRALRDDPWTMKAWYTRMGVTIAFHAPSYLRISRQVPFEGLRVLLTGGEAPNHEDARDHAARLAFFNAYGPAETAILVSLERIPGAADPSRPLTVGGPLPNTIVSIRDEGGERGPPGAVGEVWIGGVGLARGYLNRPQLTAASFVDDDGERFYRTGDLGRWSADGRLEILGRVDHQVKLHGQRLELGEIEQVLAGHPAVAQAVVLVDAAEGQTRILRAFVVAKPNAALPDDDAWRSYLAERLPAYMVPASIAAVAAIPATAAGKVDRDALLAQRQPPPSRPAGSPPLGNLEQRIAALWGELLKAEVRREDNFFALGGNSLLAVAITHRLSSELGCAVPPRELFAAPTLTGFAGRVEALIVDGPDAGDDLASDLATEGQVEFWVGQQAELDTRTFTMPLVRRIEGEAPPHNRWIKAWTRLVDRHEALRTWFDADASGALRRRVLPGLDTELEIVTLPDRAAVLAYARKRQNRAFAMHKPPLWRAGIAVAADTGEQFFWLAMHHAVGDGHSLGILASELVATVRGEALPPPALSFGVSAAREQAYLASPACDEDAAYWTRLIDAVPDAAFAEWPLDVPRAAHVEPTTHRLHTLLDAEAAQALAALARRNRASMHAVFLAALGCTIHQRTGRTDFLLGTAASKRETADEAAVVGYYVNMLPVPCSFAPGATFAAVLAGVQRALAEGLRRVRYPFARMYHEFWRRRPAHHDPARYPLFDFAVVENPISRRNDSLRLTRPGVQAAGDGFSYELTRGSPGQDVVLIHEPADDGSLMLQLQVNGALYGKATAEHWLRSLAGWLAWLGEAADDTLPELLPEEAAQLARWEQGPVVARPAIPFHCLFEDSLPDTADHAAVVTSDAILTRADLERDANVVANALLARGVRRGDVVAMLTERSPNLPAALLGVWKAGAVYLPLAADLPAERLSFIAADAGAVQLVVLDGLAVPDVLAACCPAPLRPEALAAGFRAAHGHRPRPVGGPEDVAYIIYTSGSTGRPKGTRVTHAALVNTILGSGETLGLGAADRSLMFASPSFDVSLSDICLPFAFGSALCPVPFDVIVSPPRFRAFLDAFGVTVADITPTYLQLLGHEPLPGLRILVTGGEAPSAAEMRAHAGRLRYFNAYGPTETAINATFGLLSAEDDGFLSCGRPLPNTSVSIRDAAGRRVPPGIVGEVWLGGAGLALGYVNLPEQDAAAFVDSPEGRFYRTGDLGRWRDEGALEILGRADEQVKLNGIRVELGEIEQALARHPAIAQATLLLDKTGAGHRLLAFACPQPGAELPPEEVWRPFLAERLPTYMIPAAVIAVPTIPLSSSGKVDKAALKALAAGAPADTAAVLPRTPLEREIAAIWAEVLDRSPIHRGDNFFALGGHSLLAIGMTLALERRLGFAVPARELFAEPTLEAFALRVALLGGRVPEAVAESDRATEGQREFWIAEQAGMDTRGFNIPVTLTVEGAVPPDEAWVAAWSALVDRHGALRTAFFEDKDGTLRFRLVDAPENAFELADAADPGAAAAHARDRQAHPFAMARAPLWRAGLVRPRDGGRPVFWAALHHSIGDGFSVEILVEQLAALLAGETPPAGEGSFALTAGRAEAYLAGPDAAADAAFWRTSLDALDHSAFEEWPLDKPRPSARSEKDTRGSHCFRVRLAADVAHGLRALAQRNGASLHGLMLSLFVHEVHRRTRREAFTLGTAASTRDGVAEAATVGYFVNMLPLPCRADAGIPFERTLRDTQRTLAEAMRHMRYPFARMYQEFRDSHPHMAHPGRHPLFDFAVTENPGAAGTADAATRPFRFIATSRLQDDAPAYELRDAGPSQDMVLVHEGQPDGSLNLALFANAAIYERDTAQAWIKALAGWARHLADRARRDGEALPDLLPEEAARLDAWQHGPSLTLREQTFPSLFARIAAECPSSPAIVTETGVTDFAALDRRANALAHALLDIGLESEAIVGVYADRSLALPEMVLAILKAGGAFLPLVPDLPEERLALMVRDAAVGIVVVLDGRELPAALRDAGCRIFRPETLVPEFVAAHGHALAVEPSPDGRAYVIYTSGSTGVPKGVELYHRGLANLAAAASGAMGLRSCDRALVMASPAFDAWIFDVVTAWAAGAAVVPTTRAEVDEVAAMRAKFARLGVTVASMTPSYLRLFERADLSPLRWLMTVGEPPVMGDVLHYAARLHYFNGYGPTENTVAATLGRVAPGAGRLAAGRPLANTSVHVLDDEGRPLPPGAVGEIWLGGAGLARGYLGRPELTAASFVHTPAGRLYRTGDLGRWSGDGELVVLGRRDDQVKLRGQRVELGEVRHRLEAHPDVRQAAVLVETRTDGAQTLWAFVAMRAGAVPPSQPEWLRHLGQTLPVYMMPAAVLDVPAIPMSVAGKVDGAALLHFAASLRLDAEVDGAGRTPPANATERAVARVWEDVLGVPCVGREDDFFALGGDSLRAIAAVNRHRQMFDCSVTKLYEHPVLADFARVCRPIPGQIDGMLGAARRHWREYRAGLDAYEQERERALAPALRRYEEGGCDSTDPGPRRAYGNVLLTGATGYLGAYLLRELLVDSERRVTALVRGVDDAAARGRLGQVLGHYFGDAGATLRDNPRLTVVAGDLRRDDLGLASQRRDGLADGLSAVFHAAANVSHFGHYRDIHADNVAATGHLLRLAVVAGADFHHVSTLSVCGAPPESGFRLFTEDDAVPDEADENYYVRTKQEAETLVVSARGDVANACIHRTGNLVFANDGTGLQRDLGRNAFFRQLSALLRLGVIPDDTHVWLCHVDVAARALLALAESPGLRNRTHHLENARRDTLAEIAAPALDAVRAVDFNGFIDRLQAALAEPALDRAVGELVEAFGLHKGTAPQPRGRRLEIRCDRTNALLARLGVAWPPLPPDGWTGLLRRAIESYDPFE